MRAVAERETARCTMTVLATSEDGYRGMIFFVVIVVVVLFVKGKASCTGTSVEMDFFLPGADTKIAQCGDVVLCLLVLLFGV